MNAQVSQLTERQQIHQALVNNGWAMSATFVPWSQSRNKGDEYPSINWEVTVTRNGHHVWTGDYMQGTGYLKGDWSRIGYPFGDRTAASARALRETCERGRYVNTPSRNLRGASGTIDPPDLADVMYSLVMDGAAFFDAQSFDDWCSDFGYDTDSRSAERMYRACSEAGRAIAATGVDVDQLRDLFQDY